jgi:hypothetical protein
MKSSLKKSFSLFFESEDSLPTRSKRVEFIFLILYVLGILVWSAGHFEFFNSRITSFIRNYQLLFLLLLLSIDKLTSRIKKK